MSADQKNILVVEDESSMQRLISFKLKGEGYQVDTANDGITAMEKLRENDYSALILDLMIPQLDGMQILKKLDQEGIEVSVLVLSAKSLEKDILNGLESGADDYLTKPFRPTELIARLKKLLVKKR